MSRVVLFTSGVAWYQRQGEVSGDARIDLSFPVRDMDDLLKSLVLEDLNGGRVRAASCDSHDPIDKALQGFAVDLSGKPTLAGVLDQARGEEVEVLSQAGVAQPGKMSGAIMGVEKQKRPAGKDGQVEMEVLNLWCSDGMRGVKLDEVKSIRFLNPVVESEMRSALKLLASTHDKQKKSVRLNFTGKGKRQVRVGYVVESPVWKSSDRLEVAKDGKPTLHGWAFVQNPTDEDWNGVHVRLVSGRPISFRMPMYQPEYVQRPLVELDHFGGLTPRIHEGSLESKESRGAAAAFPGAAFADKNKQEVPKGSVTPDAVSGRLGDYFHYTVKDTVNLPRRKSALIPILSQEIEGKKLSIFNEKTHAKFPLLALRLKNTSGLHLMQGPITVFDEGSYAGDARLFDLQPNEERLVSYGVDLGVEVEAVAKEGKQPERLVSIRIDKGILQATHVIRETRSYTVKNRGAEDRQVIVEHPVRAGVRDAKSHQHE